MPPTAASPKQKLTGSILAYGNRLERIPLTVAGAVRDLHPVSDYLLLRSTYGDIIIFQQYPSGNSINQQVIMLPLFEKEIKYTKKGGSL